MKKEWWDDWYKGFSYVSLDDLVEDVFSCFKEPIEKGFIKHLNYDLKEEEHYYVYSIPLPGVLSTDISVEFKVQNNSSILMIDILKDSTYVHKNEYQINLSPSIDGSSIRSSLKHGILNITVPKKNVEKGSTIKINVE